MSKPVSSTIGTTAVTVIGDRTIANAAAWLTNVVTAIGVTVKSGGRFYVAQSAGTTGATAPTHNDGDASDGAVTWRAIPVGPRVMFSITNTGTSTFYGAIGATAIVNCGIPIYPHGTWYEDQKIQGPVSLVSDASGGTVAIQEV